MNVPAITGARLVLCAQRAQRLLSASSLGLRSKLSTTPNRCVGRTLLQVAAALCHSVNLLSRPTDTDLPHMDHLCCSCHARQCAPGLLQRTWIQMSHTRPEWPGASARSGQSPSSSRLCMPSPLVLPLTTERSPLPDCTAKKIEGQTFSFAALRARNKYPAHKHKIAWYKFVFALSFYPSSSWLWRRGISFNFTSY